MLPSRCANDPYAVPHSPAPLWQALQPVRRGLCQVCRLAGCSHAMLTLLCFVRLPRACRGYNQSGEASQPLKSWRQLHPQLHGVMA